jgi:hypothetical protein
MIFIEKLTKYQKTIFKFVLISTIFIIILSVSSIHPVHADVNPVVITNKTTENTIQWLFTNITNTEKIENMTIDGYKLCNFDPYSSSFTLSDLEPSTEHTILLRLNETTYQQTTITKENLLDFFSKYFLLQFIGLLLCLISITRRIVILSIVGLFISIVGFTLTINSPVSSYLFTVINGLLILSCFIITVLEVRS